MLALTRDALNGECIRTCHGVGWVLDGLEWHAAGQDGVGVGVGGGVERDEVGEGEVGVEQPSE